MLIGSSSSFQPLFDFGAAFAKTALLAARPAFELQFFRTQEALLDNLDKDIQKINETVSITGATAFLNVQIRGLQNDLVGINDFKTRTDAKAARVTDTLDNLAELITLATPGTVAAFDAKLTETIALMETTKTPINERYGVSDRLRAAKTDGLTQLQALVHNNFATQPDIDNTTAILTAIRTDYLASQPIVEGNAEIGFNLQQNATKTISELSRQVSNIKTEALNAATDKVQAKQEQFAQVLTMISLAFEASQNIAAYVTESVALPQKPEPGSVLNLFS